MFERSINEDLFNHSYFNNLFTKNQSSLLPGSSSLFQLLPINHEINSSFYSNPTINVRGIFLHISEVVHKIWYEGLFFKLKSYGIGGKLLNFFRDYLQGSQQREVLNGQSSSWETIKSGVPKG